ncbi:MAG: hydrogenase maturation protease, partial [Jatrophihabitantaceae bacterium]
MNEPALPAGEFSNRVLVAGIGNIFLSDDGFGPEVTRRLIERRLAEGGSVQGAARPDVRIVAYGIRGMHLAYDLLDGYRALLIVDLIPRGEPGQVRVLQVDEAGLAGGSFDAHGMDPASVLGTVAALGGRLPTTYVIGCAPVTVAEGLGLSEPVSAAIEAALAAVERLLAGPLAGVQAASGARARSRFTVRGVVQGVGFRPYVYALARQLGLSGEVRNTGDGVLIEVEGTSGQVAEFGDLLPKGVPALAVIEALDQQPVPVRGGTEFRIAASAAGPGRTFVSPDLATCADCLAELADPADRRYQYPFITCTNCGPRFTIIT